MLLRRRGLLFPATGYLRDEFVSPFNGLRQRTIRAAFCVGRSIERFPLLPHHDPRRPCLKPSEREKPLADSPCLGKVDWRPLDDQLEVDEVVRPAAVPFRQTMEFLRDLELALHERDGVGNGEPQPREDFGHFVGKRIF